MERSTVNASDGEAGPRTSSAEQAAPVEPSERRATWRVRAYLRAHGLTDEARLAELAREILDACATDPDLIAASVACAQARVQEFLIQLFPEGREPVHPLWLRGFVQAHPRAFLGELAAAREAARDFGDPRSGRLPATRRFAPQALLRNRLPRWLAGLLPPLAISAALTGALLHDLARDGLTALELVWSLLFGCVMFMPAAALCVAVGGLRRRRDAGPPALARADATSLPRCAVLVSTCHEDPELVFASAAAMAEDLAATPGGTSFELFVLSDSHDPLCIADEERAFRRVAVLARERGLVPVYYRRRPSNELRKPGNLAEFFERFGAGYTYAVVLDADSLMSGEALLDMARRIHADPGIGLLQAPVLLHGGQSLLALTQQLVTSVCGPLFTRGLARWSGPHGNYYGHNAIVRTEAFMQCCALPSLPGRPPLGGSFLSHDFVEAALLCRAGWKVQTAWDLQGSWEQMPQTLQGYVARERRWCQGNLQHLRMVLAEGLRPMSRLHLALGALAYLNAPLLFAFLGLGLVLASVGRKAPVTPSVAWVLVAAAVLCLALPRLLGSLETLCDATRRRQHGGAPRLMISLGIEGVLSLALAPVLLFHHARAVLAVVAGRAVDWGKDARASRASKRRRALGAELPTMQCGALIGAVAWTMDPRVALWLSLQWLPMLLAGAISVVCSSPRLGGLATRLGLFVTAAERDPARVLLRAWQLRCVTAPDEAARFRDIVLDPVLLAAHIDRLDPSPQATGNGLQRARARALRLGPAGLDHDERVLLQSDAASLRELHRDAWRTWPIEAWNLGQEPPYTPIADGSAPRKP